MLIVLIIGGVLLGVAAVFVTALTSSYAQLERRVEHLSQANELSVPLELSPQPAAVPTGVGGAAGRAAHDLSGITLRGDARTIATVGVEHSTLLAFLSSGCKTCGRFWETLRNEGPPEIAPTTRLVVLTKGIDAESPTELHRVAEGVDIVMTTEAWHDFEIPGTPFFVLVDGPTGRVAGEGTALGWDEVRNLVALGLGDASILTGVNTSAMKPSSDAERETMIDQILMDAGIFPGDASLYPLEGDTSNPED